MRTTRDRKQHVHSDIVVLHAPDFALWRWIELGNPYYETNDPTGLEELDADFNARDKGFRLQRPFPAASRDNAVHLPFAVFEQGRYRLDLIDLSGRHIPTILEREISMTASTKLLWIWRRLSRASISSSSVTDNRPIRSGS
ncbi:MAG: hypothetical protein IPP94_11160 [Ignavibacteria bacterium]|nr:hypothetical protein [Ignavibacteria bacterium]